MIVPWLRNDRVALTGHTSGIGQGLAAALTARGHAVTGFALENGYDLWGGDQVIDRIVAEAGDCALFVNNAFAGPWQVRLLYALARAWQDDAEGRAILCTGSVSADGDGLRHHQLYPYVAWKAALDTAATQIHLAAPKLRLTLIRPGLVDTPFSQHLPGPRMAVPDVVEAALWALAQPAHLLVRSVSVTPFPAGS